MCNVVALPIRAHDGYELHHRVWPADDHRATVVLFSGVMSHAGWFEPIAPLLTAAGLRLIGADRRGGGENSVARGDAPDAKTIVDDAVRVAKHYQDDQPRFLLGWCWGAILALNVLPKLDPAGLILATPGLYPSAAVLDNAKRRHAEAGDGPNDEAVVAMPIDEAMFTDGPALENFVRVDAARLTHMTRRFEQLLPKLAFGAASNVRRLSVPTLVLLAERDQATDNAAARLALQSSATVETIDSAHGMQFDAPEAMAGAIIRFVDQTMNEAVRDA